MTVFFLKRGQLLAKLWIGLVLGGGVSSAPAESRSSTHYRVESESISAGVSEGRSETYEGTSGAGLPPPTDQKSPAYDASPDLSGQLSVPMGFALAGPANVAEGESAQFYPALALDDGTFQSLGFEGAVFTLLTSSSWSQLSEGGLLSTSPLPQPERLTLQVIQGAAQAIREINVMDTLKDNFAPYAQDGLDDAWQFAWFGANHPAGGAQADADGDGLNNAFEYFTGTSPIDRLSAFRLVVQSAPNGTGWNLSLPTLLAGRRYRLQTSLTLTPPWEDIEVLTPEVDLNGFTWSLPLSSTGNGAGPIGFYRVVVESLND